MAGTAATKGFAIALAVALWYRRINGTRF